MSFLKDDKSSFSMSKLKYIVFAIIFVAGLIYIFFNDSGVIKYLKLKQQVKALNEQISDVDKDNKQLQSEIDSLKIMLGVETPESYCRLRVQQDQAKSL